MPTDRHGSRRSPRASMALVVLSLAGAACRQDMHDQPKYSPLEQSSFFADRRSARPVIPGTVARGQLRDDALLYAGRTEDDGPATSFPFPIDGARMERGQDTFNAFCSPCHGRTGDGDGLVVQRGYQRPPSLHEERVRTVPLGHLFDVITNGFGAMPDHAAQIKPEDRWAIVAYVQALQLSRSATIDDVPAAERRKLEEQR